MTACSIHHIRPATRFSVRTRWIGCLLIAVLAAAPADLVWAGSPFATGANATQQQLVAILTPLAAVAVMVSGAMAWFGRLSWWWMVAVVIGTVLVFGGPQIVSWIRGLFGV
ncbi:TrbC/VirB2 family protein [Variovorax sp. LT1R20]|uniref:TrbC/VirB2 family protein n=1 Tax=Variovorax sp. LT1R20 TaxID=3443729 RepID=UPI003F479B44